MQNEGEIGRGRVLQDVQLWVNNHMTALSRAVRRGDLYRPFLTPLWLLTMDKIIIVITCE